MGSANIHDAALPSSRRNGAYKGRVGHYDPPIAQFLVLQIIYKGYVGADGQDGMDPRVEFGGRSVGRRFPAGKKPGFTWLSSKAAQEPHPRP